MGHNPHEKNVEERDKSEGKEKDIYNLSGQTPINCLPYQGAPLIHGRLQFTQLGLKVLAKVKTRHNISTKGLFYSKNKVALSPSKTQPFPSDMARRKRPDELGLHCPP